MRVTLLAKALRLRILAGAEDWTRAGAALAECEAALGLEYDSSPPARNRQVPLTPPRAQPVFEEAFEAAMAIQVLLLGVMYWTHVGVAAEAAPRLAHLHAALDGGALDKFKDGTVEVSLASSSSS